MDLKDLTPKSDTVDVVITHPSTGKPLTNDDGSEMVIVMYATHTTEYKAEVHRQTNLKLKRMEKSGKMSITAEELEESALLHMAKATKEWDITYDGEKPKLTVDKAKEVFGAAPWIKAQIEEALAESVDFTNV